MTGSRTIENGLLNSPSQANNTPSCCGVRWLRPFLIFSPPPFFFWMDFGRIVFLIIIHSTSTSVLDKACFIYVNDRACYAVIINLNIWRLIWSRNDMLTTPLFFLMGYLETTNIYSSKKNYVICKYFYFFF